MIATRSELSGVAVPVMEHAGYTASLMAAVRLRGDKLFDLPQGTPIGAVPLACLPGAPAGWVREAGSYVIEVDAEHGLWFSWTGNDKRNTAVIPSVKGMNPITGAKIDELVLEQYKDKCPKHKTPLTHGRFCEKCGYQQPPQNYVCAPNTLWWDGFRQPDGSVAQFYYTEEEGRDVASQVIGIHNTVPAFGFAFFKTKVERVEPPVNYSHSFSPSLFGGGSKSFDFSSHGLKGGSLFQKEYMMSDKPTSMSISCDSNTSVSQVTERAMNNSMPHIYASSVASNKPIAPSPEHATKSVGVGGGARIKQKLEADTLEVDEWRPEPVSVIRLYFVFKVQMDGILERGGVKDISGNKEGYLSGILTG